MSSLQRVKPHTPDAGHTSNPNIPIQTNKTRSTRSNYIRDSALEAPTGAAGPVTAQSIRRGRFCSLQRVKPNVPEADHASNPNNHNQNKTKYKTTRANYIRDPATEAPTGAAEPVTAQSIRKGRWSSLQRVKPAHPRSSPTSHPQSHNQNKLHKTNKIKLLSRSSC